MAIKEWHEKSIQAVLISWALEKQQALVAPNITNIYWWECDLLTATKALFAHEYEIKLSKGDYDRDFKKHKHDFLSGKSDPHWHTPQEKTTIQRCPNYFWFVTTFDIDPPEYAGWILIVDKFPHIVVKKDAPRIHNIKLSEKHLRSILKVISYRLMWLYRDKYICQ